MTFPPSKPPSHRPLFTRGFSANTPEQAEAIVVGGNGFRAVGAIDALEQALGRPVLTANQALLWGALSAAGAGVSVRGYGRLLEVEPSRAAAAEAG